MKKENLDIKAYIEAMPRVLRRGMQQFVWWEMARHTRYPEDNQFHEKHNKALEEVLCSEEIECSHEAHEYYDKTKDIKTLADELFELFCYIIYQMDTGAEAEMMPARYEELIIKYPKANDKFCLTVWG